MKKILLLLTVLISFKSFSQSKNWMYFTSGMTRYEWDEDTRKYNITDKDTTDLYFYVNIEYNLIHTPDEDYQITCTEGEYWECLDDDSTRCYLQIRRKYNQVYLSVVYYDHFRLYSVDAESPIMY